MDDAIAQTKPIYQFGRFSLDIGRKILTRDHIPISLAPKVLETLIVLVENRGRVITKDELLRLIWNGVAVEEGGLTRNISILRKVLGENPREHQFIITAPGQGYQFVADVRQIWDHPAIPGTGNGHVSTIPPPTLVQPQAAEKRFERFWVAPTTAALALVLLIPGRFQWWRPASPESSDRPAKISRLTSTAGFNTDPALTRDGLILAYASDRAGLQNLDIWVQSVGGGDPIQRTFESADESEPSFAADGSQIVFSRRDAGVFVMGTLSGKPRRVAPVSWARTPRFSPDGKSIAFWTGFPPAVVAGGIPRAVGNIYIVPTAGGEPRLIHTPLASARYPIWSPDGEYLLFLGEEDPDRKTHDWYIIPKDGGNPIKTGAVDALRANGFGDAIPVPSAWRALDHTVLLAASDGENSNIWQIPITPYSGRIIAPPKRLTFGAGSERQPAASESGRIAFLGAVEKVGVWRLPLTANTGEVTGTLQRVTDSAALDVLRGVSGDGTSLTFLSSRSGRTEVWRMDIPDGGARQLTHAGADDASASADGSKVAFSKQEEGVRRIEILDTADDRVSLFCRDCNSPSDWSSDGNRFLFGKGVPGRVFLHDFPSGRQVELAGHDTWGLHIARFSSDSRWAAFHAAPSPNVRQVYAVPVALETSPAGKDKWVPIVLDHGCHPHWSPDGTLLYYFSFRDGHFCLYAQKLDPKTKRPVGPYKEVRHLHQPRMRVASGAAAYNDIQGDYFYFTLTEAVGNIWMLQTE